MNRVKDNNVRLPVDDELEDEDECHICEDDNVAIVLKGNFSKKGNVYGNEIVLCQRCLGEMMMKANKIVGN